MENLKIKTASISRGNTEINHEGWFKIRNIIRDIFAETDIIITICGDEVVIPDPAIRQKIIQENHESPFAGHKGVTKTYNKIRQRYFRINMKKDVENFIRAFISCQKKKLVRVKTKQPMVITDTSLDVFDKIALDIVGPLEVSQDGYRYILTMQDDLPKFSLAVPLRTATATDIANALVENFICKYGCPRLILTDQGAAFIGQVMKRLAKAFKINQIKTTAFHPQSNGSLERSHQVLVDYLKHYLTKKDWDKWLSHATFLYNSSKHEGTNHTPFEIVYGRNARMPSEFPPLEEILTYDDYLKNLLLQTIEIRNTARENLEKSKQR